MSVGTRKMQQQVMGNGRLVAGTSPTDASSLPLDSSVVAQFKADELAIEMTKLERIRLEVRGLTHEKDQYTLMVQDGNSKIALLKEQHAVEQLQLAQLDRVKQARRKELDEMLELSGGISIQIEAARKRLSEVLTEGDRHQPISPTDSTITTVPMVQVPMSGKDQSQGVYTVRDRSLGNSYRLPPVELEGRSHVAGSVYAPVPLARPRPIPSPRCRPGLTPSQQERYDRNPAIAKMGLDTIPRDVGDLLTYDHGLNFGDIRRDDAARQKALEVDRYTGQPWRKYLRRYKSVIESNRWNNQQALIALKCALNGTPGDPALKSFEKSGDNTLKSLLDCCEWALNKVGKHDPRALLNKRVQKKDENVRVYGFAVQELVSEMYQGCLPDTPIVVQELTTRFVNGIRDTSLQIYLKEKWQPNLSLVDLFDFADIYETRQTFFGDHVVAPVAAVSVIPTEAVEVAAFDVKNKGKGKKISSTTEITDLENMVVKMLEKHAPKGKSTNARSKKKTWDKSKQLCRRCQKPGHYASDCKAAAPVPREVVAEVSEITLGN